MNVSAVVSDAPVFTQTHYTVNLEEGDYATTVSITATYPLCQYLVEKSGSFPRLKVLGNYLTIMIFCHFPELQQPDNSGSSGR